MALDWIIVMIGIFVGLPWVVLHYITKWKTAATITTDDESLLEDLYQLAKRLDDRMDTVERLVAADNPDFNSQRRLVDGDEKAASLRELDRLLASERAKGDMA